MENSKTKKVRKQINLVTLVALGVAAKVLIKVLEAKIDAANHKVSLGFLECLANRSEKVDEPIMMATMKELNINPSGAEADPLVKTGVHRKTKMYMQLSMML